MARRPAPGEGKHRFEWCQARHSAVCATLAALTVIAVTTGCATAPPPPRESAAPSPRPSITVPADAESDLTREHLVWTARSLLASPYRYSGRDPSGFDCSGLTSYVFAAVGLDLPRTAEAQASAGHWVAPDELRAGDLVFFGRSRNKPQHVGLVVSDPGKPLAMIHASSSLGVVETTVTGDSYWLGRLAFGRRIVGAR